MCAKPAGVEVHGEEVAARCYGWFQGGEGQVEGDEAVGEGRERD